LLRSHIERIDQIPHRKVFDLEALFVQKQFRATDNHGNFFGAVRMTE
jgi:hypothetical protein